jgi:hypothetical protein
MADKDATQEMDATEQEMREGYKEDAEEVTESSPEEEYLSEREKAIEQIAAKRDEEFEEETGEVLGSEEPKEEVVEKASSPFWKEDETWYTNVKVDGEDIQVPFDDLKSSHQKDRASQKRFEEAAEYGRRVQEREAQLNAYIQKMQTQQPPPKDAEAVEEPKEESSNLIKKYHEALYEDDADKAAELFNTLTKGRSPSATQNVEEVVEKVLTRTMSQQRAKVQRQQQYAYQKSLEDAVKHFDTEYPDIAGSPELRSIADNRTIDLTQSNPDWSPKQIMEEAAKSTRQWAKEYLSPNKNERADRKKKIVRHPKAASAFSKIGEDEPEHQSTADIIKEMKESRGQML